jgi:2-oxoisovalerate dehydrogenase E1 component
MEDRNRLLHENFIKSVLSEDLPQTDLSTRLQDTDLTKFELVDLFETQAMSRLLDLRSRALKARGESFYTIGSSGHEGNAVLGKVSRPSDMAFMHYRSGAFFIQRSKSVNGETPLYDLLLSFTASSWDPISGGRHKVLGSKSLNMPPQTSTIASHLPKAMGAACSIPLRHRLNISGPLPGDAVAICNFGDASANHSTAQGAINTSAWCAYQHIPMPLVWVCEDNGIGISTRTPPGWISATFSNKAGLKYFFCDGLNLLDTYLTTQAAIAYARERQKPVFLHIRTIRLLGHAGSDVEIVYRDKREIAATERQDPLLHSARILIENGALTASQIVELYQGLHERIARIAEQSLTTPKLTSAEQVMASIWPTTHIPPRDLVSASERALLFAKDQHSLSKPQHMAKLINLALTDVMARYPNTIIFGEDVAKKGGVYHVTSKLVDKFGKERVFNTPLDEQSILGMAIGAAHNGFIPIPEIQFLAYVHNAEDQIRGEAATLPFFSRGQYANPMVIRIAGLAYQRGFGGHFHNDNSFAVFRDVPGLILACPSHGADAVSMLRESIRLAHEEQKFVIFLEPIALYMTRDLHESGDGLWTSQYTSPAENRSVSFGELGIYGEGEELAIVTYGNGYYLSRQAAKDLESLGIKLKVIDLRWLIPLNHEALINELQGASHVLIVDECRQTGSLSEEIITHMQQGLSDLPKISRVTGHDSFIPLGSAAYEVLPSKEEIVHQAMALLGIERHAEEAREES